MTLQISHQPPAAIEHYQWVLSHEPNSADALNNLAWLYATYSRAQFRDGGKAEELARRLCEMSNYRIPAFLDTLAAACAENGHFVEAVQVTESALKLSRARGEAEREPALRERLKLYQAGTPYHEPAPAR
jgi:serine/threonine-protein kinase